MNGNKGIPDTIYLQVYGDSGENGSEDEIRSSDVTWSEKRIYPTDVEYCRVQSPWVKIGDRERPMPNDKACLLLLEDGTVVDDRSGLNDKNLLVLAWMPIPSFDEILEDNKDVRTGQPCGQGIREHGK